MLVLGLIAAVLVLSGPIGFGLTLRERGLRRSFEQRLEAIERTLLTRAGQAPMPDTSPDDILDNPVGETPDSEAPVAAAEPVQTSPDPEPATASPKLPPTPLDGNIVPLGLEQIVGTSWTVRVGGVALALGGLLLVHYSIEHGFIGPAVRCILGIAFAAALAAAGERLRRQERSMESSTQTPAILTAAATVVGFGAIYAAHGLYGLIGPVVAFVTLAVIAIGAILAAGLHGPAVAGVGLLGAFVAPLLVTSNNPTPWPVVLYLTVATSAAYGMSRLRRWLWLAATSSAGAAAWAVLFALHSFAPSIHAAFVQLALSVSLASVFISFLPQLGTDDDDATFDVVATSILGSFAAVAVLVALQAADHGLFDIVAISGLAFLVAVLAMTGVVVSASAGTLVSAGALALAVLGIWPGDATKPVIASTIVTFTEAVQPARFGLFALFVTCVVGGLGARRLLTRPPHDLVLAGLYATATVASPLLILTAAWLRIADSDTSPPFAAMAGALAVVFVTLAARARDGADPEASLGARLILGAFATGGLASVALGLVMILDRGFLTVALSLTALAAAAIASRLGIDGLRYAVATLGFVILGRLAWNPRIVGIELGSTPVLNWLLFGYGTPALAFAASARLMRLTPRGEDLPVRVAQSLAILFSTLLVVFEIRHVLYGGDPFARGSGLVEQGLDTTSALLFSLVLTRLDLRRASPVFHAGALLFAVVSIPSAIAGLIGWQNPLFSCEPVGPTALVNSLLLGYLAPAIAAALVARVSRGRRPDWFTRGAGVLFVALLFAFATLETRRLFQGPQICLGAPTGDAELWSYSAVWIALGIALLLYGIVRGAPGARLASAAVIALATGKIFLYDLSQLQGLARAMSFIGLGLALMGIGTVYQRFVFRPLLVRPTTCRSDADDTSLS